MPSVSNHMIPSNHTKNSNNLGLRPYSKPRTNVWLWSYLYSLLPIKNLKHFNTIPLLQSSWPGLWPVQVYAQHLLAECISYCIKTFEFYSLEGFSIHSLVPFVCVQCCTTQNIRDIHKLHDKSFVNKGWM